MATPFVAGSVAYLLSFENARNLSPYQIKALLEQTADKIEGNTQFCGSSGHGRINLFKAAKEIKEGSITSINNPYSSAVANLVLFYYFCNPNR